MPSTDQPPIDDAIQEPIHHRPQFITALVDDIVTNVFHFANLNSSTQSHPPSTPTPTTNACTNPQSASTSHAHQPSLSSESANEKIVHSLSTTPAAISKQQAVHPTEPANHEKSNTIVDGLCVNQAQGKSDNHHVIESNIEEEKSVKKEHTSVGVSQSNTLNHDLPRIKKDGHALTKEAKGIKETDKKLQAPSVDTKKSAESIEAKKFTPMKRDGGNNLCNINSDDIVLKHDKVQNSVVHSKESKESKSINGVGSNSLIEDKVQPPLMDNKESKKSKSMNGTSIRKEKELDGDRAKDDSLVMKKEVIIAEESKRKTMNGDGLTLNHTDAEIANKEMGTSPEPRECTPIAAVQVSAQVNGCIANGDTTLEKSEIANSSTPSIHTQVNGNKLQRDIDLNVLQDDTKKQIAQVHPKETTNMKETKEIKHVDGGSQGNSAVASNATRTGSLGEDTKVDEPEKKVSNDARTDADGDSVDEVPSNEILGLLAADESEHEMKAENMANGNAEEDVDEEESDSEDEEEVEEDMEEDMDVSEDYVPSDDDEDEEMEKKPAARGIGVADGLEKIPFRKRATQAKYGKVESDVQPTDAVPVAPDTSQLEVQAEDYDEDAAMDAEDAAMEGENAISDRGGEGDADMGNASSTSCRVTSPGPSASASASRSGSVSGKEGSSIRLALRVRPERESEQRAARAAAAQTARGGGKETVTVSAPVTAIATASDGVQKCITVCRICSRGNMVHAMMTCASCGCRVHTYCLSPPLTCIPTWPWRCSNCLQHGKRRRIGTVNRGTQTDDKVSMYKQDKDRSWLPPKLRNKPKCADVLPEKPRFHKLRKVDSSSSSHISNYSLDLCKRCNQPNGENSGFGYCSLTCAYADAQINNSNSYTATRGRGRGRRGSRGRGRGRGRGSRTLLASASSLRSRGIPLVQDDHGTNQNPPNGVGNGVIPDTTAANTVECAPGSPDEGATKSLEQQEPQTPPPKPEPEPIPPEIAAAIAAGGPAGAIAKTKVPGYIRQADRGVKPGKGFKFCHGCDELVANRRFVCQVCQTPNPSSRRAVDAAKGVAKGVPRNNTRAPALGVRKRGPPVNALNLLSVKRKRPSSNSHDTTPQTPPQPPATPNATSAIAAANVTNAANSVNVNVNVSHQHQSSLQSSFNPPSQVQPQATQQVSQQVSQQAPQVPDHATQMPQQTPMTEHPAHQVHHPVQAQSVQQHQQSEPPKRSTIADLIN